MKRRCSALSTASKAFHRSAIWLPASAASGLAGDLGRLMTIRMRFRGSTFASACWRLSALRLARHWIRRLETAKPEGWNVVARELRFVARGAERASSLQGVLRVFDQCINAYDLAKGDMSDCRSPGRLEMIDAIEEKAARRARARQLYRAKKAASQQ
jgi:hypothetical protein